MLELKEKFMTIKFTVKIRFIIPNWLLVPWDVIQATFVLEIKPQESNLHLTHKPLAMHPLSKQLELLNINSIQDGSFRGCSRMGVGPKGTLPKMCRTYPAKIKLCMVINYLKKTKKIYGSQDSPLRFCWHQHFFRRKSENFALSENTNIDCILVHYL